MWPEDQRIQDLAKTPDGERLIAADVSQTLHVYNFRTYEKEYSLFLYSSASSVTISSDSQQMLVTLAEGLIQLIHIKTAKIVRRFRGHKQKGGYVIRTIFGGRDENLVISGSEGNVK